MKSDGYLFSQRRGKCSRKVLLNSVPKSGTYLLSKALELAGIIDTGVHLRNEFIWDFREQSLDGVVRNPNQFRQAAPLSKTLGRISNGQFVVGHLEPTDEAVARAADFAHIFLVRNVLDGLVSHMRFTVDPRTDGRSTYLDNITDDRERFRTYLENTGKSYFAVFWRASFLGKTTPASWLSVLSNCWATTEPNNRIIARL
ncbi:MAG: hypothetical protein ABIY47_08125 [Opitutaceae bacterium]